MGSVEGPREEARPANPVAGSSGGRLMRLAVSCPRCGSRPAMRVTEEALRAIAHHPPKERLGTYQCQRRQCGQIYDLTAAAYQHAS